MARSGSPIRFMARRLSEGHPDPGGGPMNPGGFANPNLGNGSAGIIGAQHQVLPARRTSTGSIPAGRLDVVAGGTSSAWRPMVFAFLARLQEASISVWGRQYRRSPMCRQGGKIANISVTFTDCNVDGVHCGPDGHRVDVAGNVWSGSTSVLGYSGVTVWNPAGKIIGRVRLPEVCANICFCGPKRDWLFMAASQSVYLLRLGVQGAGPGLTRHNPPVLTDMRPAQCRPRMIARSGDSGRRKLCAVQTGLESHPMSFDFRPAGLSDIPSRTSSCQLMAFVAANALFNPCLRLMNCAAAPASPSNRYHRADIPLLHLCARRTQGLRRHASAHRAGGPAGQPAGEGLPPLRRGGLQSLPPRGRNTAWPAARAGSAGFKTLDAIVRRTILRQIPLSGDDAVFLGWTGGPCARFMLGSRKASKSNNKRQGESRCRTVRLGRGARRLPAVRRPSPRGRAI